MTTTIPVGRSFSMVKDVVYALPSDSFYYLLTGTGTDLEVSNDGSTWTNIPTTALITGKFVRIHDNDAKISIYH